MLSEAECKNSGGYFKDPFTGQDIGPDYPRVITCKPGEKWQQPAVCFQDGNIVKISGRCWNDDERACYKEYRGLPSKPRTPKEPRAPRPTKPKDPAMTGQHENDEQEDRTVVKYDPESAASPQTLLTLAECDRLYGVSQIAGITYVLCGKTGSNTIHHIPRCVIPDAEFERLNDGC